MKLSDYENAFSAFVNSSILSPFVKKFVRWAFPRTSKKTIDKLGFFIKDAFSIKRFEI